MSSLGQETAIAIMNRQQLQMSMLALHKIGCLKRHAWRKGLEESNSHCLTISYRSVILNLWDVTLGRWCQKTLS